MTFNENWDGVKRNLTEAANANVIEAERLRKEAIEAFKKALKTPNLARETQNNLKYRIKSLTQTVYTSPVFAKSNFKVIIPYLKGVDKDIQDAMKLDPYYRKLEAREKKTLANPYTICDLLSDPKPNRFINLMKNGAPELLAQAGAKWIDKLNAVRDAFDEWFESEGGRKMKMTKVFTDIVACGNRAPWAAWRGKAYRGLTRTPSDASKYEYTGEIVTIGRNEWLVAKGTYKSRYEAQSWSDEWKTAENFSNRNLGGIQDPVAVVFEVELTESDTLLTPDVAKRISNYGRYEREVIRVGNRPLPVKVYVNGDYLEDIIEKDLNRMYKGGSERKQFLLDRAVAHIGAKGAEVFAKTKYFNRLVKGFS